MQGDIKNKPEVLKNSCSEIRHKVPRDVFLLSQSQEQNCYWFICISLSHNLKKRTVTDLSVPHCPTILRTDLLLIYLYRNHSQSQEDNYYLFICISLLHNVKRTVTDLSVSCSITISRIELLPIYLYLASSQSQEEKCYWIICISLPHNLKITNTAITPTLCGTVLFNKEPISKTELLSTQ